MKKMIIFSFISVLLFGSCSDDHPFGNNNESAGQGDTEWLIPQSEIRDGGPGKDGIPALTEPELIPADEASWIDNNELVLGFADGEDIRTYPHQILDWHEIINDKTGNHSLAVIYCPLTGTGIGWNRLIEGRETTFGVSGLLYNSNIIPYDRATDSNWSQILLKSVNGELSGKIPDSYNLIETTWETWNKMYPSSQVVSRNTGYNRSYGRYPYGNYRENESLIFPVSNNDDRLHPKKRVLAVIRDGQAKAYTFDGLDENQNLILDDFKGTELVVAGSREENLIVAFQPFTQEGVRLEFQYLENSLPEILVDNEGNSWDVFGRAVSGPRKGEKLRSVPRMMGYWFSFSAFYPEIELFEF